MVSWLGDSLADGPPGWRHVCGQQASAPPASPPPAAVHPKEEGGLAPTGGGTADRPPGPQGGRSGPARTAEAARLAVRGGSRRFAPAFQFHVCLNFRATVSF